MTAGAAAASESERARSKAQQYRERAERLERRAEVFDRGQAGELRVAQTLDLLLPAGYARLDDVRWPGTTKANIDHVVFGPGGMFVVDAKNWTGDVVVRAGVLRQNGYRRTRETDKVLRMTADLQAHLGASVGQCQPVLCLVGQPTTRPTLAEGVTVVGIGELGRWLFTRPEIWPASHVAALAAWLPHVLTTATDGRPARVLGPTTTSGPNGAQPTGQGTATQPMGTTAEVRPGDGTGPALVRACTAGCGGSDRGCRAGEVLAGWHSLWSNGDRRSVVSMSSWCGPSATTRASTT